MTRRARRESTWFLEAWTIRIFFDVRLSNTNAESQVNTPIEEVYIKQENEKNRKYNDRVLNNEHGSFTPLVFSINEGMSGENMLYHKHFAEIFATKTDQ